jgi:hypothetical protein
MSPPLLRALGPLGLRDELRRQPQLQLQHVLLQPGLGPIGNCQKEIPSIALCRRATVLSRLRAPMHM